MALTDTHVSSIDPADVARFSAIAAEWWDPEGKFAPLHRFNPCRLGFIRDQALARFGRDPAARRPFEGLRLLDIGCGGGLLSEPMTRLGFAVTGVDASERNIGTASTHAAEQGLSIDYRAGTAEQLEAEPDLTDEMYAKASMHDENGAWQMLFGLNTLPEYRKNGYAGELLHRAVEDARKQGRKGAVLTCKQRLVDYYAKFCFVDEGVTVKSVHGGVVWHQMRITF